MQFTKNHYINDLTNSILNLNKLELRIRKNNPIQNQYVGTATHSIISIFCSALNSIREDNADKNNVIKFEEFNGWIAIVQIFQRMAFSILHSCIEKGMDDIFKEKNIEVISSESSNYLLILEKIKLSDDDIILKKEFEKMKLKLKKISPSFKDRFNKLLSMTDINSKRQNEWRIFLDGFSVLRNKSSHTNIELSKSDIEKLKRMNLDEKLLKIFEVNKFTIYTQIHAYIAENILNFWDEILPNIKCTNYK